MGKALEIKAFLPCVVFCERNLSHIINAEGEKLQYVLGTLNGGRDEKASVEEVLAVNKSIKCLLDSVMQNQLILKNKMECAVGALEKNCHHTTGPTGPKGPTGSTGGTGATGPKGPQGSPGSCCAISFRGRPGQCWATGDQLIWSHSKSPKCCLQHLSPDKKKIVLGCRGFFVVSFSIDLCIAEPCFKSAAIGVQIIDSGKKSDSFVYHTPVICEDAPYTASASGILITTQSCSAELMLTLLSPDAVKVNQASICVMEL